MAIKKYFKYHIKKGERIVRYKEAESKEILY